MLIELVFIICDWFIISNYEGEMATAQDHGTDSLLGCLFGGAWGGAQHGGSGYCMGMVEPGIGIIVT